MCLFPSFKHPLPFGVSPFFSTQGLLYKHSALGNGSPYNVRVHVCLDSVLSIVGFPPLCITLGTLCLFAFCVGLGGTLAHPAGRCRIWTLQASVDPASARMCYVNLCWLFGG